MSDPTIKSDILSGRVFYYETLAELEQIIPQLWGNHHVVYPPGHGKNKDPSDPLGGRGKVVTFRPMYDFSRAPSVQEVKAQA